MSKQCDHPLVRVWDAGNLGIAVTGFSKENPMEKVWEIIKDPKIKAFIRMSNRGAYVCTSCKEIR